MGGTVELTVEEQRGEWLKCARSPAFFIDQYVQIYDKIGKRWIPFRLWRAQFTVLQALCAGPLNVILKARQLGMTWLALAYHGLWRPLFEPIAKVGIFSKRDDEAVYLLGEERLKGMYKRLPTFLQAKKVTKSDGHTFGLSNGSMVRAFPTTAGDAYAMTDIILDEFDLVPDQNGLMRSVKPTMDGGGSMTMVSRADKSRPRTSFKRTYRGGVAHSNGWHSVFLPWFAHPDRDEAWYEAQKREIFERTGSLDELYEQYPATDEEALSARTLDKRIAPAWLRKCYRKEGAGGKGLGAGGGWPAIPGLEVYRVPHAGREYRIGLDPAEGNPTSDDSALAVVEVESGEECAALAGKFEPSTIAAHADAIGNWFNQAAVMCERNNHGHAVILWFRDHSQLMLLPGHDNKAGWLSNSKGKAILYDDCANAFRDGNTILHSAQTFAQLSGIEGSTLRAPEGEHDDRADGYALALVWRDRYSGSWATLIGDG